MKTVKKPAPPKKNIRYTIQLSNNLEQYEAIYHPDPTGNVAIKTKFENHLQKRNPGNKKLSPLEYLYLVGEFPYYNSYMEFEIKEEKNQKYSLSALLTKLRTKFEAVPDLATMKGKVKKITSRWLEHPATSKKKEILDNFVSFCEKVDDYDSQSRVNLVLHWLAAYATKKALNPFYFLSQHRRPFSSFVNFFRHQEAESVKLFRNFLKGETIPPELELLFRAHQNVEWDRYQSINQVIDNLNKMKNRPEEQLENSEQNTIQLPNFLNQGKIKCVVR
jgi:hypothetical protein